MPCLLLKKYTKASRKKGHLLFIFAIHSSLIESEICMSAIQICLIPRRTLAVG